MPQLVGDVMRQTRTSSGFHHTYPAKSQRAGQNQLWLARQISATGGLSWTVEAITEIADRWDLGELDLQQGGDGGPHLAYVYDEALYYTVYSNTAWLTPTVVITAGACSLNHHSSNYGFSLALDQNDLPHIVCGHDGATRELRFYTYTASAPWTTYEVIANGGSPYYYPSLVYDGGTPHVSYFHGNTALYHAQPGSS